MEVSYNFLLDTFKSILILACLISYVLYTKFKVKHCYWCKRGVPYVNPLRSWFDSLLVIFHRIHWVDNFNERYQELSDHKYGGLYSMTQPQLLLKDPEIIEEWLVRNFNHFHDRGPIPNEEMDPVSANLYSLTGERWRLIRQKLSPAFSSSKVKIMYESLKDCAAELRDYLDMCVTGMGNADMDIQELMYNYSLEMIGTCGMGVKFNAIYDPNSKTKKLMMESFRLNFRRTLYYTLDSIHPKLPKLFGLKAVRQEVVEFIRNVCKEAEEMKAKGKTTTRKDFLQILIDLRDNAEQERKERGNGQGNSSPAANFSFEDAKEAKEIASSENSGIAFTENVLIGAMGSFMTSGVSSIASTLTFCFYELALNPDIQNKIFDEIQLVRKDIGNEINYDDLSKLKYMTQVIHETLRKYPIGPFLTRVCTEPFLIPNTTVVVEKGVRVFVPTYALHHDQKFFPSPEKFDPDRFSEENIGKIQSGAYIPFGEGPRFCIAARFVMITVKMLLIIVMSNFFLRSCDKTPKKLKFDTSMASLSPDGELWLQVEHRKHTRS